MKFIFSNTTYIFRPKIIPIIATILGLAILLSLSVWQMKRLSWKKNLIETRIDRYEKNSKELDELKDISNNTPAAVQGLVTVVHVLVPR